MDGAVLITSRKGESALRVIRPGAGPVTASECRNQIGLGDTNKMSCLLSKATVAPARRVLTLSCVTELSVRSNISDISFYILQERQKSTLIIVPNNLAYATLMIKTDNINITRITNLPESKANKQRTRAQTGVDRHMQYQMELMKTRQDLKEPFKMARQNTEDSSRTKVDDGAPEEITSQDNTDWPENCLFFDPYTMDANQLRRLLWQDSAYVGDKELTSIQRQISCISLPNAENCSTGQLTYDPTSQELSHWLSDTEIATKIAYIGAKRSYLPGSSRNMIGLPLHEWQQVLHSLQTLPGALELLHDNNGGFNYLSTSSAVSNNDSVSAFHICIKLGGTWRRNEHFCVARHNFLDDSNVVLIAGTNSHVLCETLYQRLSATERTDIFCILVVTLSLWLNEAEKNRWLLDYDVQEIERKSKLHAVQYERYEAPTPEQLNLPRSMAQTRWSIGLLVASMENTIDAIDFAKERHIRYHAICCKQIPSYVPPCPVSHLQAALSQYRSQARSKILQMQMLQERVASQIAVTNTLIAHRDSRATIDLALAMKADSKLMKRLSLVTVIFLPATFLATFFSMIFFHMGGSDEDPVLEVSSWIWLYPLCTMPLTLFLVFQYGLSVKLKEVLKTVLPRSRPSVSDRARASDSEAQTQHGHRADEVDSGKGEKGYSQDLKQN